MGVEKGSAGRVAACRLFSHAQTDLPGSSSTSRPRVSEGLMRCRHAAKSAPLTRCWLSPASQAVAAAHMTHHKPTNTAPPDLVACSERERRDWMYACGGRVGGLCSSSEGAHAGFTTQRGQVGPGEAVRPAGQRSIVHIPCQRHAPGVQPQNGLPILHGRAHVTHPATCLLRKAGRQCQILFISTQKGEANLERPRAAWS